MESIGRYRLDSELGRGAMGVVYRGFDPKIGRDVAIKVIRLDQSAAPDKLADLNRLFSREAAAAGKLSHPNIVTIYDFGEQADLQYLVLELVDGCSLEKTLANGTPQDRKMAVSVLSQVAGALDYAHGKGIVHRDVKPANILVRPDGGVKITDFGIARIADQTLTRTGLTMGTPAYMAPEQIMSGRVTGCADQFSLAVMAFQMLSGRMPFVADGVLALMHKIASQDPPALRQMTDFYPARTSDVLMKAMAKNPDVRYRTCAEFVGDLSASLEERQQTAPDQETTARTAGRKRAWLPWATAIGATALVSVILLGGFGVLNHPAQRTDAPADTRAPRPAELTPPAPKPGPRAGDSKTERDGLKYMKYMWIPPGTFTMGCSPGDSECDGREKPAHSVTITKGFWLGQTDVTQAAYQRLIGSNPSHFKGDDLPVETVNWDEARSYCQAIGGRLPTEAEWEYAARAGSSGARYGNLDDIAWYLGNSGSRTHEVGQKRPNPFGLYDMLGNVLQWTADWYGEKYYQAGAAQDPAGPATGTERTLRGGSWGSNPANVRASFRSRFVPGDRLYNIGLRCVGE